MTFPWLKTNAIWIDIFSALCFRIHRFIHDVSEWVLIKCMVAAYHQNFKCCRPGHHVTSRHVMSWWADNNVQYVGWCQQIAANKDITCYALTWVYNNNFFKQIFDVLFLSRSNLNLHTWAILLTSLRSSTTLVG